MSVIMLLQAKTNVSKWSLWKATWATVDMQMWCINTSWHNKINFKAFLVLTPLAWQVLSLKAPKRILAIKAI